MLDQLIRTTKPLVDAIGNLEARESNLADCLLEMIRCARLMSRMKVQEGDDPGFLEHAKAVLNKRFRRMNTPIHSLVLFLHPLCRKLAISDEAGARDFEFMISTALKLAEKWKWSQQKAMKLVENMKAYNLCKAPFVGGNQDGLTYWESLAVSSDQAPLKQLAITLFLIVPDSSDVERLFSDLGGIQTPRRNNLNIDTFENLGKMRCNLRRHHHAELQAQGKPIRRKHGHMHTKSRPGINTHIVEEDAESQESTSNSIHWQGPLTSNSEGQECELENEDLDMETSFDVLEKEIHAEDNLFKDVERDLDLAEADILDGRLYDFKELENVDKGVEPKGFEDEIDVLEGSTESTWSVQGIMHASGL
ncbi:hypothetical protein VKT23_020017 [Stygiomarasmius scandens]|uniref:HAT C-terminal dimerisation domain-containing protein n=1 Tax=Marasmiellus scandens TaxID=2682957 RepID=A0ABR1IJW2_9AGAR